MPREFDKTCRNIHILLDLAVSAIKIPDLNLGRKSAILNFMLLAISDEYKYNLCIKKKL